MESNMQFGVFSVGDVTRDPVSGDTPSEHERIKALTNLAVKTEEVGFDPVARYGDGYAAVSTTTRLLRSLHLRLSLQTLAHAPRTSSCRLRPL